MWMAMPVFTLIRQNILPDDLPARRGKQPVAYRNIKNLTKPVVIMKRNMNECAFLAGLWL